VGTHESLVNTSIYPLRRRVRFSLPLFRTGAQEKFGGLLCGDVIVSDLPRTAFKF